MDDRVFEALADADRRHLLSVLAAAGEDDAPLTVPDDVVEQAPDADADALATRLHHAHLPKLAAMDYVEWEPATGRVSPGPAFGEVEALLSVLEEHERAAGD
jgi:hypothetical protein